MTSDQNIVDALYRDKLLAFIQFSFSILNDGITFEDNWHINAMAHQLERCERGETQRLIITVPPRHLKTHCVSIAFIAWLLGRKPSHKCVNISYSEDLVTSIARNRRKLMESKEYKRIFPGTKITGKNTEREIETSKGGGCFATSVGGTLTGRGGNYIIFDDPLKAGCTENDREIVNEWYRSTIITRLNNPKKDVIIIVMQRIHYEDLVGCVQELDDWEILNLPAIAEKNQNIEIDRDEYVKRKLGDLLHPERMGQTELDRLHRSMGSVAFEAQYQQNPVPPGGIMIKREWFKKYEQCPQMDSFNLIIQSWDTATETGENNDYSVCTTWGVLEHYYYLLDVYREKLRFPDLCRQVIRLRRDYGAPTRFSLRKRQVAPPFYRHYIGKQTYP